MVQLMVHRKLSDRLPSRIDRSSLRFVLGIGLVGLLFGLIGFGEIIEDGLRIGRNSLHPEQASGEIVLLAIDDASLREVGSWPWPRRHHARMVEELSRLGAKRVFFDIDMGNKTSPAEDRAFEGALRNSRAQVVLPARLRLGTNRGPQTSDLKPLPQFTAHASVGTISGYYNYAGAVWSLPYAQVDSSGSPIPSFSALLGGTSGPTDKTYPIDYSIRPQSVPAFSPSKLLSGKIGAYQVAGKDVIIGATADQVGDMYYAPGYGEIGGVYSHILGAETLKKGHPIRLGWLPSLLLAIACSIGVVVLKTTTKRSLVLGSVGATLLVAPLFLEAHLIFVDITAGLFVIVATAIFVTWQRLRRKGETDAVSGLPNLNAIRELRGSGSRTIVAARVRNYTEIASTLDPDQERQLIEQITARLTVGAPERVLYQTEGGAFAWFMEPGDPLGYHLDALHGMFRNPARVAGTQIDLAISFGVELGSGRSPENRLASALIAADEAASESMKWKTFDLDRLTDASWRLSLLGQLDQAIDKGEIWIAYQPKLDLTTGRISGAEALARWTHPEKGAISPIEFITQAEQHDRIEKLTCFILEQAIAAAAEINAREIEFSVAVNLSARLTGDRTLPSRIADILARHRLEPRRLILELTETAALRGDDNLIVLNALCDSGIRISIDDYGTGQSTLDYLKRIPASELKIDQSFIRSITDNRSDRLMVQSTIVLAHQLGRSVVAEGVESKEILDLLKSLECDVAQGYAVGRPGSLEALIKRLVAEKKRAAA